MSDLTNPLFDNQLEYLERQKEEYKNALMGDVEQIKSQGQEIGKKVAVAGGIVVAGLLLRRMFSSSKKKAPKTAKAKKGDTVTTPVVPISTPIPDYDPIAHAPETVYTSTTGAGAAKNYKKTNKLKSDSEPGLVKKIISSELTHMLARQGLTMLVAFLAKKAADSMHSKTENNDIAAKAVPATEADPVVISATEKHAI